MDINIKDLAKYLLSMYDGHTVMGYVFELVMMEQFKIETDSDYRLLLGELANEFNFIEIDREHNVTINKDVIVSYLRKDKITKIIEE